MVCSFALQGCGENCSSIERAFWEGAHYRLENPAQHQNRTYICFHAGQENNAHTYLFEEKKVPRGPAVDISMLHRLWLVWSEELDESPTASVLPLLKRCSRTPSGNKECSLLQLYLVFDTERLLHVY